MGNIFQICPRCEHAWCDGGPACRAVKSRASRRYVRAVQAYSAARDLYREYSAKNRPPEVKALYEAAKLSLYSIRKSQADSYKRNQPERQLLLVIFPDKGKMMITQKVPDVGSVWPPGDTPPSYFVDRVRKVDEPETPMHYKVRLRLGN